MTFPKNVLHQILQHAGDCREIMSFCQTNSEHYELFKKDAVYVLIMAIENKYKEHDVQQFTKQLYTDIKRCGLKSPPFAYLSGTGIYQKEFDQMPVKQISPSTNVTWKEIRDSLLYLSKSFKDNRIPKSKKYYPLLRALNQNLYKRNSTIPLDTMSLVLPSDKTKLIYNGESRFSRARLKYIGQRDEGGKACDINDPVFKMLKSINFDKYIDEIIKLNKHRWTTPHRFDARFHYPLVIPSDTHTQPVLIKILCAILKGFICSLNL